MKSLIAIAVFILFQPLVIFLGHEKPLNFDFFFYFMWYGVSLLGMIYLFFNGLPLFEDDEEEFAGGGILLSVCAMAFTISVLLLVDVHNRSYPQAVEQNAQ